MANKTRSAGTRDSETLTVESVHDEGTSTAHYLVLIQPPGPMQYRSFPLSESPQLVGRGQAATIDTQSDDVSREHARLTREGNAWLLEDLESTNGTFVESERISSRLIRPGTRFQLAHCEFILLEQSDPLLDKYRGFLEQQRRDSLTGLPNHQALEQALSDPDDERDWLVLLQVGALDRLNVLNGRATVDGMLRSLSARLRDMCRGARLYRVEGGRFACVGGRGKSADPRAFCELLVQAATESAAAALAHGTAEIHVGCAIVGSRTVPGSQLLETAEHALVKAGRLGNGMSRTETATSAVSAALANEDTGVIRMEDLFVKHREHELADSLKPGWWLLAMTIEHRLALRLADSAALADGETALEDALRRVASAHPYVGKVEAGEADDVLFLTASSAAIVESVAEEVQRRFEARNARARTKITLRYGPAVEVTMPATALAEAVRGMDGAGGAQEAVFARLPLPIGHALRALESAPAASRFFAVVRLHQAISRWLFAVFGAELARLGQLSPARTFPRLDTWLDRPVSDRHWVVMAQSYHAALAELGLDRLIVPHYVEMMCEGDGEAFRLLDEFARVRNRIAHGQHSESMTQASDWEPRFRELLATRLQPLQQYTFRYVSHIDVFDEGVYDVNYKTLCGDNLTIPTEVVRQDRMVLQDRIVTSTAAGDLSLTPFALYLRCPSCSAEEIFFLDQLERHPTYASIRDGVHAVENLTRAGKNVRQVEVIDDAISRVRSLL